MDFLRMRESSFLNVWNMGRELYNRNAISSRDLYSHRSTNGKKRRSKFVGKFFTNPEELSINYTVIKVQV